METTNNPSLSPNTFKANLSHSLLVFLGFSLFYTFFFSPVLFSAKLLAPLADGIAYYLPAFYGPKTLWTSLIFSGYPINADPQNMAWYPPALLLNLISHSWNAFVVLAYVLAGSFAYCYTYTITQSKLAATMTGLIYSMSGFMIGHLGHVTMIHTAAWIPLIVCALEKLRHKFQSWWFAIGILAVACCFLGGHPQVSVYGIGLGFFYALFLGWNASIGRWKYYRLALGVLAIGILLCSIQLVPTLELSRLSLRSEMTYDNFIGGSLSLWQLPQLFFPFFFGGWLNKTPYDMPYWGEGGVVELTGYIGLLPIMLSIVGTIVYRNRPVTLFWFWVGLITLLLVLGDDLFLGRLLYYVPVYNKFRIQARHFVEFSLSVSVLAGLGVSSTQHKWVSKQLALKVIIASAIVMLTCLLSIAIFYRFFQAKAGYIGIPDLILLPWKNPAIGIPLIVFLLGVIALALWIQWSGYYWSSLVLLLVLVFDISSFGLWFYDWESPLLAPNISTLNLSPLIKMYRDSLNGNYQRFLTGPGLYSVWDQNLMMPNLTRIWELPNASGYTPLVLSKYSEMMQINEIATLLGTPVTPMERQLDLMSVRYLLTSSSGMVQQEGLTWADAGFPSLGSGECVSSDTQSSTTMDLQNVDYEATAIGIVTQLGCSVEVPDQSEVAQVEVTDAQGNRETHSLLAGRDTAEYAYDCADVKPNIKHQRAQVFSSAPTSRPGGGTCQGHEYVAMVRLNRSHQISNLKLNWSNVPAVMNIKHISLINEPQGTSLPLTSLGLSKRWRKVEQISSDIIYENQQAMPRVWLVPETIVLKPEEILTAVHTSQLPDGRTYDPKTMALVEDAAGLFQAPSLKPTDRAEVLELEETQVELQTQTDAPAFLVLSDVFYPGWKATIDGKPTQIFQTNYIQRGIKVPAGNHIVRFEFHPLSFKLGVGITMASFFGGAYWLFRKTRSD